MRNRLAFLFLVSLTAVMALPGPAAASGVFNATVIHDFCGHPYTWTNHFKVQAKADGSTSANRLTIDSWAQSKYYMARHPHWITTQTWSQVSLTFTSDGTAHSLAVGRSNAGGGIEQGGRIVMKLKAWHNSTVLWGTVVTSQVC